MTLCSAAGWAAGPTCRQRAIAHHHDTSASLGSRGDKLANAYAGGISGISGSVGSTPPIPVESRAVRLPDGRSAPDVPVASRPGSFPPKPTSSPFPTPSTCAESGGLACSSMAISCGSAASCLSCDSAAPRLLPCSSSGATGCPASLGPPTGPRDSSVSSRSLVTACILLARSVSNADRTVAIRRLGTVAPGRRRSYHGLDRTRVRAAWPRERDPEQAADRAQAAHGLHSPALG